MKVKLRMGSKDLVAEVTSKDNCQVLVDQVKQKAEPKDLDGKVVKLFFSGKELAVDKPIGQYFNEDSIVVVFLRPAPASA